MEEVKILDKGYVRLVETWGSDQRIIEAARMSTQKGFLGWGPKHRKDCPWEDKALGDPCECDEPGDEKLLKRLWDMQHATPFEMAGIIIEVKAPLFVFREWHRHRTQSYNEMSARYIPLPDENYEPDPANVVERAELAARSKNKQAQSAVDKVPHLTEVLDWIADYLQPSYELAQTAYEKGLVIGIPKELARLPVPVARYSVMRASANLRNWLGFLKLRCDPAAQWEIRQFANAVGDLVETNFPRVYSVARESIGLL